MNFAARYCDAVDIMDAGSAAAHSGKLEEKRQDHSVAVLNWKARGFVNWLNQACIGPLSQAPHPTPFGHN